MVSSARGRVSPVRRATVTALPKRERSKSFGRVLDDAIWSTDVALVLLAMLTAIIAALLVPTIGAGAAEDKRSGFHTLQVSDETISPRWP
jgi:hypothetical protein